MLATLWTLARTRPVGTLAIVGAAMAVTFIGLATSPAAAQTRGACGAPANVTGTSSLAVHLHDQIVPNMVSTSTIEVPKSWPHVRDLLHSTRSSVFTEAMACVTDDTGIDFDSSFLVTLTSSTVRVTITSTVRLDSRFGDAYPWSIRGPSHRMTITRRTAFQGAQPTVYWTSLDIDIDDGVLHDAQPVPVSADTRSVHWQSVATASDTVASLDLPTLASMKLASSHADDGNLRIDSDSVSNLAFAGLFLALLAWTLRRSEIPQRRRLFAVTASVLLIYCANVSADMYSSLLPGQWSIAIVALTVLAVATAPFLLTASRWFAGAAFVAGATLAITYASLGSRTSLWPHLIAVVSITVGLLMLAWLAPGWMGCGSLIRRGTHWSIAVGVTLLGLGLVYPLHTSFGRPTVSVLADALDVPINALTAITVPCLMVLALARATQRTARCRIAALTATATTWMVYGNGLYLGVSVPMPALLCLAFALPAFRFGHVPQLADIQARVYPKPEWHSTWRSQLFLAQTQIVALRRAARGDLDSGAADDGTRLTKARERIVALRQVPPQAPEPPGTPQPSTDSEPLPTGIDPIDLVRAYGRADHRPSILQSLRVGVLPAMLAAGILTWASERLDIQAYLTRFYSAPLSVATGLAIEITFFLAPVALLGGTWQLFRASGSARAIVVWAFTGLPLIVHLLFLKIVDQPIDSFALIRSVALLVILLFCGIVLDMQIVRAADDGTRLALSAYRVVNARPLITAVTTLIIPLATAGLAIWQQVEAGITTPQSTQACPPSSAVAGTGATQNTPQQQATQQAAVNATDTQTAGTNSQSQRKGSAPNCAQ